VNGNFMEFAEAAFNLSQRAVQTWEGSNWAVRRELLEIVSLNRELDATSLALAWNKPFDAFADQPVFKDGGRDCLLFERSVQAVIECYQRLWSKNQATLTSWVREFLN